MPRRNREERQAGRSMRKKDPIKQRGECRRTWEVLLLGQDARMNFLLYGYGEADSFPKQRTEQPTPALALARGSAAPSLEVEGSQWLEPVLGQARAASSRCGKDKAVLRGEEEKK